MAPINIVNVPRPGSGFPAALSFVQGAPSKRKAAEVSSSSDINTTAKRQKSAPDLPNPRAPAKTPRAAKKASGRPRTTPAATADSAVATNAALTPAPAASAAPSPSVASNVPIAAQDTKSQPTVTSTSIHLPPPRYYPGACKFLEIGNDIHLLTSSCFTSSLPAPITPWPHDFPAPTPRLLRPLASCPVDWSKVPGLDGKDIEAYELRAPWNPHQVTFDAVAKQSAYSGNEGKQPSMEAVRKRFKNANSAIFKRTGVYFPESSQGLEAWAIKKPVATEDHTPSGPTPTDEWTVYRGDVVAVQLKASSDNHPSVRICDAKLIPAYDELVTYEEMLDEDDEPYIEAIAPLLPFSTKAFDRWHSSVCHGNTQEFPKRTLVCKQINDDQYMLRVNSKTRKASAGLMLETYVVSQAMGTTEASDMILGRLRKKLNHPSTPAFDDTNLQPMRYLQSDDPVREIVNRFRWRTAGSSPRSEYSVQDDDEEL